MVPERGLGTGVGRVVEGALLVRRTRRGDARQLRLDAGHLLVPFGLVPHRLGRVVADDEAPRPLRSETDLFHLEVVPDDPVATGPAERRLGVGAPVAHLLARDVVPAAVREVGEVVVGGEPPVDDGDDAPETPVAQVVADPRQQLLVRGVAGEAPDPDRDPLSRHRQADDDLGEVGTMVLRVAEDPEALSRPVLLVELEVGGGGVEEQQVDLEVEEVCHREEDGLLHLGLAIGRDEEVHRPVGLVLVHRGKPGDRDVLGRPGGGGELRGRIDRPVGDEREQHPLHVDAEAPSPKQAPESGVDPERVPQRVKEPRRPHLARPSDREALAERFGEIGARFLAEVAVDRMDETAEPVEVERVLPTEVDEHLRHRRAALSPVVGELDVADDRTVLVLPLCGPQVHACNYHT